jgi:hypothetical protein
MGGDTLKASLANMTTENQDDSGLKLLKDYKSRIILMLFPAIFYSIFYLLSFFLPMMRVTEEHRCQPLSPFSNTLLWSIMAFVFVWNTTMFFIEKQKKDMI